MRTSQLPYIPTSSLNRIWAREFSRDEPDQAWLEAIDRELETRTPPTLDDIDEAFGPEAFN